MSAHKLRRGFRKEVEQVFDCAHLGTWGPEYWDESSCDRMVRLDKLKKELWTTIRELQKAAKGSAR